MKTILVNGTVEKAPCDCCGSFVEATYNYGPVQLDAGLVVEDVMRATCNQCGAVVATAPQSAHRFKAALEDRTQRRTTVRIPQELHDFISLTLSAAGADVTHAELYFRALLLACRQRESDIGAKLATVHDAVLQQPYRVTVNLTLGHHLAEVLERLRQASGLTNVSELLRRLVVLADGELAETAEQECVRLAYAYA